ncbi:uncharacterized protein BXZ73DRAFT_106709 [Epithele typhae]|uniref:uncharacterized protein n=1 Tax=Epithele typhae TaxID=378194 RepID=UPI0020082DEB|nr:uncharacterized protein BXZ73DRAFT_106709 [Epithele typhae]KAH9914064.1 hypothetical protein BXZ73DRAFT_106709 [Epithele typhae]
MSGHRSLSDIQDILYDVFPLLDPDDYGVEAQLIRRTLLAAGLTCRNFMRPAITVLWRSLPGERPLVSLLLALGMAGPRSEPSSIDIDGDQPSCLAIPQGLCTLPPGGLRTHSHWGRFREYANQVRKINLDTVVWNFGPSLWSDLLPSMDGEPILPRLLSVRVTIKNMVGPSSRSGIGNLPLLSPTVKDMTLVATNRHPVSASSFSAAIKALFTSCPNVEQLSLPYWVDLQLTQHLPNLRRLNMDRHLWSAAHLSSLTSALVLDHLTFMICTESARTPFTQASLADLGIGGEWENIHDFIDDTNLPAVRSLSTSSPLHRSSDALRDFPALLTLIPSRLPHLTKLHLHAAPNMVPEQRAFGRPPPVLPFHPNALHELLKPLFSLRDLVDFKLNLEDLVLRYSSNDLRSIAATWPALHALHITFETSDGDGRIPNSTDGTRARLDALAHLARGCPRLRALHLPAMDALSETIEGEMLRELEIDRIVFVDDVGHVDVTAFMRMLFPGVHLPSEEQTPMIEVNDEGGGRSLHI